MSNETYLPSIGYAGEGQRGMPLGRSAKLLPTEAVPHVEPDPMDNVMPDFIENVAGKRTTLRWGRLGFEVVRSTGCGTGLLEHYFMFPRLGIRNVTPAK